MTLPAGLLKTILALSELQDLTKEPTAIGGGGGGRIKMVLLKGAPEQTLENVKMKSREIFLVCDYC